MANLVTAPYKAGQVLGQIVAASGMPCGRHPLSVAVSREISQVHEELPCALISSLPLLLQALPDDAVQLGGYRVVEPGDSVRLLMTDPVNRVHVRRAREGEAPGCRLIEDHAEGEQVSSVISRGADCLFGAHVVYCAHHDARLG